MSIRHRIWFGLDFQTYQDEICIVLSQIPQSTTTSSPNYYRQLPLYSDTHCYQNVRKAPYIKTPKPPTSATISMRVPQVVKKFLSSN
jgi:hypothetical protein